jgi:ATP-dependent protease ClpP protease subunit
MARIRVEINGVIGEDWWDPTLSNTRKTVMEQAAAAVPGDTLEVHVNSGGGDFFEGLAIMNTLHQIAASGVTVETWVDGLAASAASLIMLAGSKRVVASTAMVMVHNVSMWAGGDALVMERAAAQLRQFNDLAAVAYAERTKETRDGALALMDAETWMDGAECLERGFATETTTAANDDEAEDPARTAARAVILPQNLKNVPDWLRPAASARALTPQHCLGRAPRQHAVPPARNDQGQAKETKVMDPEENPAQPQGTAPAAPATAAAQAAAAAATKAERSRVAAINTLFDRVNANQHLSAESLAALRAECIGDAEDDAKPGLAVAAAQERILNAILEAKGGDPANGSLGRPPQVTQDGTDKFIAGVTNAVLASTGMGQHDPRNEFNGVGLRNIAAMCLERQGRNVARLTNSQLASQILNSMHTSSDFPLVLENIATKSVLKGYSELPEVYEKLSRKGTLNDYKEIALIGTAELPTLERVEEGGEYTEATFGERGARMKLAKYGRVVRITEEMIINDDTGAFSSVPRKMGQGARRTIGNLFWAIWTANPTFNGSALFSAGRKNLRTGAGSVLDDAGLTGATTLFETRVDADMAGGAQVDAVMNITPKYLVVPKALKHAALRMMKQEAVNGTGGVLGGTPNTHAGSLEVVHEARLDRAAGGTTRWFLSADPDVFDTIGVSYLDGRDSPEVTRHEDWKRDSVAFKVKQVAAVAALDFAGMQRNEGA